MKRHATDMVSLVFGIVFLIIAGWWLVTRYVHLNIPHLGWVAAAALIAIGALGIVGSLRGDRSARTVPTTTPSPLPSDSDSPSFAPERVAEDSEDAVKD